MLTYADLCRSDGDFIDELADLRRQEMDARRSKGPAIAKVYA
jgi:hypothetical protein